VPTSVTFIGGGVSSGLSTATPVEIRMLSSFPYDALEQVRRRVMGTVTTSTNPAVQARTTCVIALSTELRGMFSNLLGPSGALTDATAPDRRRVLDIDTDIDSLKPVYAQALRELGSIGMPAPYRDLLLVRLRDSAYAHRVAAACGIVLTAALLLQNA
jgi:hypothetical protein